MRAQHPTPRESALDMLDQVLGQGRLMSELTGSGAMDTLAPADRARAQRLTLETLRGLERADRILERHLRKVPPLRVRNVLRLATIELCQGGAGHGVVNEAVSLVGAGKRTAQFKGLVNAVLRKVAETGPQDWGRLRVPRLPKWLREPLRMAYGPEVTLAIEAAHFAGAPLDLTPRVAGGGDLAARLGGKLLETGSIRIENAGQVSALAGFEGGEWWVQDAAAALPALILAAQPGERVLDMCAAPGGKTLQMAAAGAEVTAIDISERRIARLRENLERTGLSAELIVGDVLAHDAGGYDAILLDAPCSATGTIRRHPDLPHAKDGSEFMALFALQEAMLDHALTLLKPGGRLVYCTCSLLPDEGEAQIDAALLRHPGLRVDAEARHVPGVEESWQSSEGGLRLRPDCWAELGGMDGFYIACLTR